MTDTKLTQKPWWWPEKVDSNYFDRLRDDYPERAHMTNGELEEHFEVEEGCFSDTWDHLGDAREEYEYLADFALEAHDALKGLYDALDSGVELTPEVMMRARAVLAKACGEE
ncbi:hypothetical protein [Phaeobacter italicus]|jgi:hypothetical protein|uniref:hypothetical protein n=1 Tax=Phaeobacter italicus TaxID=481446 RepID=UPI002FDD5CED